MIKLIRVVEMKRFTLFLLAPGDALFHKNPSWRYIFNIFLFFVVPHIFLYAN